MQEGYILGIDTSNYTSSIALVDFQSRLVYEKRALLDVKKGERGLRQSDALFQHIRNIPELFKNIPQFTKGQAIKAVAVSNKPRPIENSYMPVFLAGKSFGETIASFLDVNCFSISHQENHLEAAQWSIHKKITKPFLGVHISGGTTEILYIRPCQNRYTIEIVGGSRDISAGQLIDRIGVAMGLAFPCGKSMDIAASQFSGDYLSLPLSVKEGWINFSGIETKVQRIVDENKEMPKASISKALLLSVAKSLEKAVLYCSGIWNTNEVLWMGGVASSVVVRGYLQEKLSQQGLQSYFGKPEFCTDNGVGTALLGLYQYLAKP
ncbi:MAG: O-sialoglycoprotein endopeptidase [Thermotaleaceae bacterium]